MSSKEAHYSSDEAHYSSEEAHFSSEEAHLVSSEEACFDSSEEAELFYFLSAFEFQPSARSFNPAQGASTTADSLPMLTFAFTLKNLYVFVSEQSVCNLLSFKVTKKEQWTNVNSKYLPETT